MNFEILIIGTDINAYYMARCCHELYHKKVHMIGKKEMGFSAISSITDIVYVDNLWDKEIFCSALKDFGEKQSKKILLIGTNDFYVRLIVENKDFLSNWYVFNYPKLEIVDNFLVKEKFYKICDKYNLDYPKTLIYDCKNPKEIDDSFQFPIIAKPGDGVSYYKHKFVGQSKVYKIKSYKELKEILEKITESGYDGNMIIQEFIPGDDSCLFDSVFYVGTDNKVKLTTFAQIGLQEHTNTGVGNCTLLINGFNEYGDPTPVINNLIKFMEEIGYSGFAEFDLKYDCRDQKYKIFEINPRQGRSSYYLTACGYNLIKYLVDDVIDHKELKYHNITNKMVLSFVPTYVIKKYVDNKVLKREVLRLKKEKKFCSPLNYKDDKNLKRKIYLFLRKINYIKKYKDNTW